MPDRILFWLFYFDGFSQEFGFLIGQQINENLYPGEFFSNAGLEAIICINIFRVISDSYHAKFTGYIQPSYCEIPAI
jgi:hypothetical protein